MLSQDHSSFSTGGWCSIYPTKLLHKLSGTISGKLIYVAVILPGFFQWLWCVTGKDTLSMQCSLHVWIPQQLTDSVYGSVRGERGFRMLEIWYKQSCVFLMEMRMHSNIMGVIQANTDTKDALPFALVLDLVRFLQLLSVCLFRWGLLAGPVGRSMHIYGVGSMYKWIQREVKGEVLFSYLRLKKHGIWCDTRQHKLPPTLRELSLYNYSTRHQIFQ